MKKSCNIQFDRARRDLSTGISHYITCIKKHKAIPKNLFKKSEKSGVFVLRAYLENGDTCRKGGHIFEISASKYICLHIKIFKKSKNEKVDFCTFSPFFRFFRFCYTCLLPLRFIWYTNRKSSVRSI